MTPQIPADEEKSGLPPGRARAPGNGTRDSTPGGGSLQGPLDTLVGCVELLPSLSSLCHHLCSAFGMGDLDPLADLSDLYSLGGNGFIIEES